MRRLGAKALVWSALALVGTAAALGTGCTAKKPTELVPGVSSQMVVPKDLTAVSVQIEANGGQVFCRGYQVSPETHVVDLPSTLGVIPAQSPGTVVTITIRGYDGTTNSGDWDFCNVEVDQTNNSNGTNPPRILRRSTQTYVDQHTLFLPMPLSYSCMDVPCPTGSTCKGNQCVGATIDQTTLPDFDPTLIDGTGLCFSPSQCFPSAVTFPAAAVDTGSCIYSLPWYAPSNAAFTSGVNVKVFYQDMLWQPNTNVNGAYEQVVKNAGEEGILNADPDDCGEPTGSDGKIHPACEGFKVLPPEADAGAPEGASAEAQAGLSLDGGKPMLPYNPTALRIQLAPGLCNLVQTGLNPPTQPASGTLPYRTISDISLSGVCQPKLPLLPICAGERNNNPVLADAGTTGDGVCNVAVALNPAPSVLYLIMDDTAVMHGALGPSGSLTTLALSFKDPVFKRTYSGFKFMTYNDQQSSCTSATTAYTTPDEPPCTMGDAGQQLCLFNAIKDVQPLVASQLSGWTTPANEITPADAGPGPDGGPQTIPCYADLDCVNLGAGSYCAKPNTPVSEGGVDAGGPEDAGDDGGDAGLVQGACTNPQALDLIAAMRPGVGAYAQISQYIVNSRIAPPGVAAVMFFVNRVPETALGVNVPTNITVDAGSEGGSPEAGVDAGEGGIPAYPSPIGALDCPAAPPGVTLGSTPLDQGLIPNEALNAQQIIESEALNAFMNGGLQTYFVVLDDDRHNHAALPFFQQIAADLTQTSGATPVIVLDATDVSQSAIAAGNHNAQTQAQNFANVVTELGTCLYEIPETEMLTASTDPNSVEIQYSTPPLPGMPPLPPGQTHPTTIPHDATCSQSDVLKGDAGTANGWAFEGTRIRICGAACDGLRSTINNASTAALAFHTPIPDVPVTITPLCSGTSGSSDATTGGGG